MARALNLQQNVLVHGGGKKIAAGGLGFKSYDSIYKVCAAVGRIYGMAPQVPGTFKNIGIEGELHQLLDKDVNLGLDAGVFMTRADGGGFEIVEDINTLQNNSFLVNPDGTTYNIALGRIERQLNKELVANAKTSLLKKPNGSNRNTVSAEDVKTFVENFLQTKVATDQTDNLIISFQAVNVVLVQTSYQITYAFVGNTEISHLFFTGTMIDG